MKVGDRVQLLAPLHRHPSGELRFVACMDAKGDASGECGLPNLRGTVTRGTVTGVGILIDDGLMLYVLLDRNGQETRVMERAVRPLDVCELLAELA